MHLRSGVDETRKRDLEPFFRFRLGPARDRRLLQQKSAISAFRFRSVSIEERVPQRRYPSSPSGSRTNCGGIGNSKMRS